MKNDHPFADRQPPSDSTSERALIGALLNDPRRIFDVRALLDEGDVFYTLELADLYKIILSVGDAGTTIRPLTIIQKLTSLGRQDLLRWDLMELTNEGTGCDVVYTSLHLRELYIKRLAASEALSMIRLVADNQPLDVIIDKARSLNIAVTGKTNITKNRTMGQVVKSTLERIAAAAEAPSGLSGVPTGSKKIDSITGGWQISDVAVPAGRPGMAKTVVLLHHAKEAAKAGYPTTFISLEIDAEQCTNRLISSECLIPYSDLLKGRHDNGRPFSSDDWKVIGDAADYIASLPIHFYEGGSTDINDLVYAAYDFQQKHMTMLTVMDYMQKAEDRLVRSGKAYEVVSSISGKIKSANLKMKQPWVVGSQLSRAIESEARKNKRPQLDDLRESGKIEEDASIVSGLYRDDYYKLKRAKNDASQGHPFIMPEFDNKLEYDFLKNRNGKVGMVKLWVDVKTNRILDNDPNYVPSPPRLHTEPPADRYVNKFPDGIGRSFAEPQREESDDPNSHPF